MINDFKSRQVDPGNSGSACTIEFFLPQAALVTLSILSEHGKNFEHIIEKVKFESGKHQIKFEPDRFTGNICFYRLAMLTDRQEIVDTKKISVAPPGK